MVVRRVRYHDSSGELSVDDVARIMSDYASHSIVIGVFKTGRDIYLNVLHGVGGRKWVWFNIEDVRSKWSDPELVDQFINKYLNATNNFKNLTRLWVMDDIEDLSSFLHDYKLLRSIDEEYR